MVIIGDSLSNSTFISLKVLSLIQVQWLPIALVALSSSILFSRGGFDWSFGVVATLSGLIAASPIQGSSMLAILIALGIGLVNGTIIVFTRYPGILVTLMNSFLVNGLILSLFKQPISCETISEKI